MGKLSFLTPCPLKAQAGWALSPFFVFEREGSFTMYECSNAIASLTTTTTLCSCIEKKRSIFFFHKIHMAKIKNPWGPGMPYSLQSPATCIEQLVIFSSRVTSAFFRKHCLFLFVGGGRPIWAFRVFVVRFLWLVYFWTLMIIWYILGKHNFAKKMNAFLFLQGQRVRKLNFLFFVKIK